MPEWSGSTASFSPLDANRSRDSRVHEADSQRDFFAFPVTSTVVPGLLVSVRNLAEAKLAAQSNISILDIKEPSDGPLAPASQEVWEQIAEFNAGRIPLSAALGEFDQGIEVATAVPKQFRFAKVGPCGSQSIENLHLRWQEIRSRLSPDIELVAVAYADHRAASCPTPAEVFGLAAKIGMKTWLVDTFEKDGKSSLDHLSGTELLSISAFAKQHAAKWVLAGSMRIEMLEGIGRANICPDLFGVRGDVCRESRASEISVQRIDRWLKRLQSFAVDSPRKSSH